MILSGEAVRARRKKALVVQNRFYYLYCRSPHYRQKKAKDIAVLTPD
jgi:hypothetical protein